MLPPSADPLYRKSARCANLAKCIFAEPSDLRREHTRRKIIAMKKVNVDNKYAHGIETVMTEFRNPEFYVQKFEWVGDRNVRVNDHGESEEAFWIETQREVPVDVPGVLKSILGEWNDTVQKEHWVADGEGYRNELELSSEGVPVSITGTMYLTGDDTQCVNRIEMRISSSVPFLGGQLEKFVAGKTLQGLEYEYDFISQYMDLPE